MHTMLIGDFALYWVWTTKVINMQCCCSKEVICLQHSPYRVWYTTQGAFVNEWKLFAMGRVKEMMIIFPPDATRFGKSLLSFSPLSEGHALLSGLYMEEC